MSVRVKYYIGMVGQNKITDAALSNVSILCVTRSGMVYSRGIITPGNLQFVYSAGPGRITFQNVFNGPAPDLPVSLTDLEQVSVKYKT
jgi:hypothetical protein